MWTHSFLERERFSDENVGQDEAKETMNPRTSNFASQMPWYTCNTRAICSYTPRNIVARILEAKEEEASGSNPQTDEVPLPLTPALSMPATRQHIMCMARLAWSSTNESLPNLERALNPHTTALSAPARCRTITALFFTRHGPAWREREGHQGTMYSPSPQKNSEHCSLRRLQSSPVVLTYTYLTSGHRPPL